MHGHWRVLGAHFWGSCCAARGLVECRRSCSQVTGWLVMAGLMTSRASTWWWPPCKAELALTAATGRSSSSWRAHAQPDRCCSAALVQNPRARRVKGLGAVHGHTTSDQRAGQALSRVHPHWPTGCTSQWRARLVSRIFASGGRSSSCRSWRWAERSPVHRRRYYGV